jgi:glycosyltransferase XagB
MEKILSILERIELPAAAHSVRDGDHNSGQKGVASDNAILNPAEIDRSDEIELERNFLFSFGWRPEAIREIETEARNANVGIIQSAIASGALNASEFYDRLSKSLSFARGAALPRVRLPSAPAEAWLLLGRPVPIHPDGSGVVALNGQTFSIATLISLSKKLGERRKRLKLLTRQELIDSVTRSYGRVLVAHAVAGLLKARPDWSAKCGLAAWQVYFSATACGLFLGAVAIAPRESFTIAGLVFSIFFLLAVALRFCAVLSLVFPARRKTFPGLLGDADLPSYTIFVPLFKEVEILPHLAAALAGLDYPDILAHLPEGAYFRRHGN